LEWALAEISVMDMVKDSVVDMVKDLAKEDIGDAQIFKK
jgi:nitrogen regulatory protein PII